MEQWIIDAVGAQTTFVMKGFVLCLGVFVVPFAAGVACKAFTLTCED